MKLVNRPVNRPKQKKGQIKKVQVTTDLAAIWKDVEYLIVERNFYFNFEGYMDVRSCKAVLILRRILSNVLDKYSEEDKEKDNWDNIVQKERNKILHKYFVTKMDSRIQNTVDWLRKPYSFMREYKTLRLKPMVTQKFMNYYEEVGIASAQVRLDVKARRKEAVAKNRKFHSETNYYFPKNRHIKLLNLDVYRQPSPIKHMIFKDKNGESI